MSGDWDEESEGRAGAYRSERSGGFRERENFRENRERRDSASRFGEDSRFGGGRRFQDSGREYRRESFGQDRQSRFGDRGGFGERDRFQERNRFQDREDRGRSQERGRFGEGFGHRDRFQDREGFQDRDRFPRRDRFEDSERGGRFGRRDPEGGFRERRGGSFSRGSQTFRRDAEFSRDAMERRETRFSRDEERPNRFSRPSRPGFGRDERRPSFGRDRFGGRDRFSRDGREERGGRFPRERNPFRDRSDRDSRGREARFSRSKAEMNHNAERHAENDKKKAEGYIRLNKYIANAGVCSRREADEMIASGVITVNGEICTAMGTLVGPDDKVQFAGQTLKAEKKVYLLMNKPKGYITTADDPEDRKTVMDLLRGACSERIYPVGRLDRNTTGVLLFTNDGDLAKKLTHPSHGARKIYHVTLEQPLSHKDMQEIAKGVYLEDGLVEVDEIAYVENGNRKEIGVQLHSGKNRIVRRIFEHFGYEVVKLDRVLFAELTKKGLSRGEWRFLSEKEVGFLRMNVGKGEGVRYKAEPKHVSPFTPEQLAEAEAIEEAPVKERTRKKRHGASEDEWETNGEEHLDLESLLADMEDEDFDGMDEETEMPGKEIREIEVEEGDEEEDGADVEADESEAEEEEVSGADESDVTEDEDNDEAGEDSGDESLETEAEGGEEEGSKKGSEEF